jgi:hypothetical protein
MQTNQVIILKKAFDLLADGDTKAASILIFLKGNYKEWQAMFIWLRKNNIRGKKLVELFQNESPDGGGYHMGATYILSRIKGHKHEIVGIKADELL